MRLGGSEEEGKEGIEEAEEQGDGEGRLAARREREVLDVAK